MRAREWSELLLLRNILVEFVETPRCFLSFQEGNMISSVSGKSNKSGTSHSPEYDMEAAVRLQSGSVGQELVGNQTFLSTVVGFCYGEQRMQNRAEKGFQTSQLGRTLHQSSYPLQHRYLKLLSWPVIAVLIGVLVALLVFGFYSPSTRSIATTASQAEASRISHGCLVEQVGGQGSGDADNAGGRQLLQAGLQAQSKGKYLRGYAELGAELTKKKRMRKNKNKETEAPPEDPRGILALRLCERFPGWRGTAVEYLFVLGELSWNLDMSEITRFFNFCDEFPQLVGMVDWSPILVFSLFYLRDTLGHTGFTVLFVSFPAFVVVLILLLLVGPWRLFHRFLILLSRVQGKKRS